LASFVGSESNPHSLFPELNMTSTETATATASDANKILDINVNDLTFRYQAGQRPILSNLNMQLTDGARCLLIGANGAGLSPPSPSPPTLICPSQENQHSLEFSLVDI
jgi:ABC-type transport system involved in cytochrome bd biosynthesis fused ATPase/permease subunit